LEHLEELKVTESERPPTPKQEKNRRQGMRRQAGGSSASQQADLYKFGRNEFSATMNTGRRCR
jgi:hypothetical protein